MIDKIDLTIGNWIRNVLPGIAVSLRPPLASETGQGVGLYLLGLIPTAPGRGLRQPPTRIVLRYLVTTWADEQEKAHQLMGDLVFAALENAEIEVELEPVPLDVWTAFGVTPRPSFVLRVPLQRARTQEVAPPVRQPLVIKASPMRSLDGLVVGPGNIPLMNARVELPALQLATETDFKGRFHFAAVPAEPRDTLLRVRARGREFSVSANHTGNSTEPLVIQLQLTEE